MISWLTDGPCSKQDQSIPDREERAVGLLRWNRTGGPTARAVGDYAVYT